MLGVAESGLLSKAIAIFTRSTIPSCKSPIKTVDC